MRFGKALKMLRLINELTQLQVAHSMHMEERTYREIESDRKILTAEQVLTFAEFYKVDVQLIYNIAQDNITTQNIVHEAKRDGIVINNGQENSSELITYFLNQIKILERRIAELEQQ